MKTMHLRRAWQRLYHAAEQLSFGALLVLALAVLPNTGLYAQTTVTGKVLNEQGQPLAGASVAIKGTKKGTSTDAKGNFSLSVPSANAVLQISFSGYQLKEVALGGKTAIEVQMALGGNDLTDVVVVGYGTQKKLDMTGSVSTIKG
ncbi:MAG: carboxypeptidase-like regulatory domain-containing protein, partial [Chitinophagaceae bacterium]|nr:carboxypeptidase-like regulatory domain-containing protein [Chitinophagaceae bacterium]